MYRKPAADPGIIIIIKFVITCSIIKMNQLHTVLLLLFLLEIIVAT